MHVEHSLALQKIADILRDGESIDSAIKSATKFLKTQGFGAAYSKKVAIEIAAKFR